MSTSDTIDRKKDLFGHPRGLSFLFATEMWERFSYYGMRSLMILYLTKYVLLPGHAENVIGYFSIKAFFESMAGPLDVQPLSSLIYGTYTGLVYFTPLIGGLLADRVWGQRKTVILGAILMAMGHFLMAFEQWLFIALLLLILGNGAFKPNMSTQVGGLYRPGDSRIDRAYSIFYVGINIGAFFSPLVCGTLGEEVGWHYGFGAAGVGMLIGLTIYLLAGRNLPPDNLTRRRAAHEESQKLTRDEWRSIFALIALCLPATLFWATYEQQGNTIALWADGYTNRALVPGIIEWEMPTSWIQAINPFMIFVFTPFLVAWWGRQAKRGREMSTVKKMAFGCFLAALSYLVLAVAAFQTGPGEKAGMVWIVAYFVILTIGELYVSPVGLSLFARVAPLQVASLMMGFWLATSFLGNFLAGYLGSFWDGMEKGPFFVMIAAVISLGAVIIWAFDRPLQPILQGRLASPGHDQPTPENPAVLHPKTENQS